MISVSLQQLATILEARLEGDDRQIEQIVIDTRQIVPGCLFVAIKGERFDGHDFAQEAVQAGATALLVSKQLPINIPQLLVKETRLALGQLGAWARQQSTARVVALTGSSGKTSVKEMTASILKRCGEVLYTKGNLNNDIGVPLTLLRLQPHHQFAVIELGANHPGEIAYTTALVQPEAVLVNNLSAAHLAGFGSLEGVAKAKGEIFAGLPDQGIAIINADSNDWQHWQHRLTRQRIWRFSIDPTAADFYPTEVQLSPQQSRFILHTPVGQQEILLPLPGQHNIANALAAAALAMSVGASLDAIQQGLAELRPVSGRLSPISLAAGKLLLDDTYNANVGSMTAAAETLAEMPGYRVMVVGEMAELGESAVACHQQIGAVIRALGIEKVLSVGELSKHITTESGCGEHFNSKDELVTHLKALLAEHSTISILIKGSRSSAMEQIVQALQEWTQC